MAFRFSYKRRNKVGLIISDHTIRMVEVQQGQIEKIINIKERYLPEGIIEEGRIVDEDTLSLILEECVEEWGIKRKTVHITVPDALVAIKKEKVPAGVKEQEMKGYLYLELGTTIHLPFEDPVFDFKVLSETNHLNEKEILLFAAPENIVNHYVEMLENVKIKVTAVDVSALALYRLYCLLDFSKPNNPMLMIKYDIDALNVSIFHDHKPVFIRHIMLSTAYEKWEKKRSVIGTEVLKWVGEQTTLEEEISNSITEIRRIMDFYRFTMNKGEQEVVHILLTGDHPEYKVIENKLRDAFNIAVTIFEDKSLKTVEGFRLPLRFYSSLGLAVKEV